MKSLSNSFNSNSLWSLAGGGVPALAAVMAVPALFSLLGIDKFALVSLLISLNLFFFVYDFGLTRAMHFFSPKKEYQHEESAGSLIGSSLIIAMIIGTVVTLIIITMSPVFCTSWLEHTGELAESITKAFQLSALGITPALLSNVIKGNLEGKHEFKKANLAKIFSGSSLFVGPIAVAIFSDSIIMLAVTMMLTRFASLALYCYFLLHLIRPSYFNVSRIFFKSIISYSFWAGISGFFATLFIYGDRFIVAGFINSTELSIYIASQDILIRYLLVPWSIAIVLSPFFSSDNIDMLSFKTAYMKAMKTISLLTICFIVLVCIAIIFFIPIFVEGRLVELSGDINFLLTIGIIFASFSQLPLIFLYAQGEAKLITGIFLFEGMIYLVMAPFIFSEFGVIGAASVWSLRLFIEFIFLSYFTHKILKDA